MGARRLLVLIKGLPPSEAAVWREESGWQAQHELAAASIELADYWGRNVVATLISLLAGDKQQAQKALKSLPKPVRVPRPGDEPERPQKSTPADVRRFLSKI